MKKTLSYWLALLLSAGCLALVIVSVAFDQQNRDLQTQLQDQIAAVQAEMQKVSGVEGISRDILADLDRASASNVEIRVLLARHGYAPSSATNTGKLSAAELERGLNGLMTVPDTGLEKLAGEKKP